MIRIDLTHLLLGVAAHMELCLKACGASGIAFSPSPSDVPRCHHLLHGHLGVFSY
jgi:hypothetical protein